MLTASEVARCFINIYNSTEEGITNLKLQKLLYYAQGFSYQRLGRPLFEDEIEAWEYGPVVASVFREYRKFDGEPIRLKSKVSLSEEEERLILDVAREYGQYTSAELVNRTHRKGTPWDQVYDSGRLHNRIPKSLIEDYFSHREQQLEEFRIEDVLSSLETIDATEWGNL